MEASLVAFVSFLLFLLFPPISSLNSDGLSLLALKAAITLDPHRTLSTWRESDENPCRWVGISCISGRVSEITLPNKALVGYIPSELGFLLSLKRLSLAHNNFSNPIPSRLFNATSLTSLDLSHNWLSGRLPPSISTLKNLTFLDLSANQLNGSLPDALPELPSLSGTLNLSYNRFSGRVPDSFGTFRVSVSLDLQHNNLSGPIPQIGSLLNQGPTAFAGNPFLCGFPLQTLCSSSNPQDPESPANPANLQNPLNPRDPETQNPTFYIPSQKGTKRGLSIPILSGVFFVAGTVVASVWFFRRKRSVTDDKSGKERNGNCVGGESEGQDGEFHVLDEGFGMEMEELLRASAYVVGKSRTGIVYKVVVGKGVSVAVKRLNEGGGGFSRRFKEFEAEVEAIARVRHPNIVRLRAYYYANDEKLLVSDYISNGTLHSALHGGCLNSESAALTWATRVKIIQGAARALSYLHDYNPRKYVHASLKSSKLLLDHDFLPYISCFGLTRLVSCTYKSSDSLSKKQTSAHPLASSGVGSKIPTSPPGSYVAPEARPEGARLTQKCDVYAFGIILLEVLTGRFPDARPESNGVELEGFVRQAFKEERPLSEIVDPLLLHEVYAKKQVLATFHVALGCTEVDPEMRPRMRAVSECLDRIGCH